VRYLDCDGFRVMTAARYPMYMDFIWWEMIARSKLFDAVAPRGLAPTPGSQKLTCRRPLIWNRDVPTAMDELLTLVGAYGPMTPPDWVTALFGRDKELLARGAGTTAVHGRGR